MKSTILKHKALTMLLVFLALSKNCIHLKMNRIHLSTLVTFKEVECPVYPALRLSTSNWIIQAYVPYRDTLTVIKVMRPLL